MVEDRRLITDFTSSPWGFGLIPQSRFRSSESFPSKHHGCLWASLQACSGSKPGFKSLSLYSHWLTNGQLQAFWFSFHFMYSFDINLIKPNLVLKKEEIKVICCKLKNCEWYRKHAFFFYYSCFCKILSILVSPLLKVCKNCTDMHY